MKRSLLALVLAVGCTQQPEAPVPAVRPSVLLVTLDTTRADAMGAHTPAFNELASRSRQFKNAYATAPQTLPSHSSMMTGLYPAGHGVHENARQLATVHPLLAEKLTQAGYRSAAFVSAFPLARRFGLARGFEVYDDTLPNGRTERSAKETTDRALAWLGDASQQPVFLWVHYFEPHYPYESPDGYRGEIATMDAQLGRLVQAFETKANPRAIIVVGDHGEGLGEHGEAQHGNLLYQGVMHVPLLVSGPNFTSGAVDTPVSTRRIFHTILDWAGLGADNSLRTTTNEVVLGEAMVPFLQYGWQPQVMAVENTRKAIHAGAIEVYDVVTDPTEVRDLNGKVDLSRNVRKSLTEYPVPSMKEVAQLDDEARRQLASLGYITADVKPVVRKDAPRPRDMTHLFATFDQASGAFERGDYAAAIPLLEKILKDDPNNLMAALRLAAAHSALGKNDAAMAAFRQAETIAPQSPDVRAYLALHLARIGERERAAPMLEQTLAETPDRLPALEALAEIREREGKLPEALALRKRIHALKTPSAAELVGFGQLAMAVGDTASAIDAFEKARAMPGFRYDLELGVLYLASRRFEEARAALDRALISRPDNPMALFKRAQVSVLLGEADRAERIAKARQFADDTTRELIASERLFR
ncbi:MAG TPA: sulfatase-like hydrolase/transferase [Thermoanaerobaculia bacterium]|nr:sulfatase-like hydrolase/transferase [Thermoanaerobaculia bacterium]